jgi:lipopolysaccharide/colanic/teichoic acid biosynthesis glycosyltransferase/glycosyltransferase involved in cell wall biosynthesis
MISVIIPAYNSEKTLPSCLQALARQTVLPDEVIVVDDGSTDSTVDIARQAGVKVIIQAHHGPAAARNLGAQSAQGDLILFTDSDCEPCPDWVNLLTQPFKDERVIGVKGTYLNRQKEWAARLVQQEYEAKYDRMGRQASIDFIDTYSAAYRRDIFLKNDGFDAAFPVPSVEDQEFSFRLARKGYRLVFAREASVYHYHDRNLTEYLRRKYGIGYWKAFMLRWLPEKTFSDSHTLPSQRWQILLLGLVILFSVLGLAWLYLFWIALSCLLLFIVTALPFFRQVWRRDRGVVWAVPVILVCRAATLGCGLLAGFLFPPSSHHKSTSGLMAGQRLIKRTIDILGAAASLIISLPVLVIAGIAIKIDSPGPVFFLQERCGENGKPFRMVKLRTMRAHAEEEIRQVLDKNHLDGPVFKIKDDPRVTRVGRLLRRFSIDEIPQFWNILRGEMSLVGPRPEETWVVAQYDDFQRQRLLVKPGLTGPMQVYGRGDLDLNARLALELDYIQFYSPVKDIIILLRTIPAVISGKGAY